MCCKELLMLACMALLLGGLRLTSTTTTTTFVAAMSIANPDLERYFRSTTNLSQPFATMSEERIAVDMFTYAFLNYSSLNRPNHIVNYTEEKARYGEGKILSVTGKLVHISNVDDFSDDYACSPNILGTRGAELPPPGTEWIALVQRGRCTFEEKVKNVHDKGAHGVIVYNDKTIMNLEKMQIKGKSRNITAVITFKEIGLQMVDDLDKGHDIICSIIEGRSGVRPINSLNRTSVLFVSISFIVLMVISLVWLIFYYIQRFRYLQTKDQQSRQLCSVTKKAIMKIPTKTGKCCDEKDLECDCCAICIEAYKASDCIRVLPCKHEFHKNCIDPWLIEHRTCPMCKLDVLKFYGYVVGDQIHSTPSPQHTPPNLAPVDANDVPVIVVAIPHSAPSSQQSPSQVPQQDQEQPDQGHLSYVEATAASTLSPQPTATTNTTVTTNCGDSRSHSRNHSCSYHHHHQHQHHNNNNHSNNQPHHLLNHYEYAVQQQQQQQPNSIMTCRNCSANSSNHSNNSNPSCNDPLMPQNSNNSNSFNRRSLETRRNSAPQVLQVSTASHQFLGSEESILEYEAERAAAARNALANGTAAGTNALNTISTVHPDGPNRTGVLTDLIRSRDFVIDFPRIFVLDAGSGNNNSNNNNDNLRTPLFARLPERSQSSLSLTHARDWMSSVANKLEEQQGQQCRRKTSNRYDIQENLLSVRTDSVRKRRSRSADGRYSSGHFSRMEITKRHQTQSKPNESNKPEISPEETGIDVLRRNSNALHHLTEASYALSSQRNSSDARLFANRSDNGIPSSPTNADLNITIQINGEGVDYEE